MTLTLEEYESLAALARVGVIGDSQKVISLDQWLQQIERNNGITRSFLMVQWQELGTPLPSGTRFPETWPPNLRKSIELITRKVARVDVDAIIEKYATNPTSILVTPDRNGIVGWTPIENYFI